MTARAVLEDLRTAVTVELPSHSPTEAPQTRTATSSLSRPARPESDRNIGPVSESSALREQNSSNTRNEFIRERTNEVSSANLHTTPSTTETPQDDTAEVTASSWTRLGLKFLQNTIVARTVRILIVWIMATEQSDFLTPERRDNPTEQQSAAKGGAVGTTSTTSDQINNLKLQNYLPGLRQAGALSASCLA